MTSNSASGVAAGKLNVMLTLLPASLRSPSRQPYFAFSRKKAAVMFPPLKPGSVAER